MRSIKVGLGGQYVGVTASHTPHRGSGVSLYPQPGGI